MSLVRGLADIRQNDTLKFHSPSQGSLQRFLCFPQIRKMSALSPLLFLEVLKLTCQMAMLSFPSPLLQLPLSQPFGHLEGIAWLPL